MKKHLTLFLSLLLILSLLGNMILFYKGFIAQPQITNLSFENANEWENYFQIHNITDAQNISRGKGVKVGIIDHYFGTKEHSEMYQGDIDLLGRLSDHQEISEHGYWMSCTLREIAPECEIYAISGLTGDTDLENAQGISKAVDWAIENNLDILTYSNMCFESEESRQIVNAAVKKAFDHNIVTTFIHCDSPENIHPTGMYEDPTDFTIYSYDYNTILSMDFEQYGNGHATPQDEDATMVYYSQSSMSVVTAGFVAILKSIQPNLSPSDYRNILVSTAHDMKITEPVTLQEIDCKKVADILAAIDYMKKNY